MKRIIILTTTLVLSIFSLKAQNDIDAFRFSQANWMGTARFMGAGGAFGAVGAEFSALSINPATIGVYKRSEVTFTPMVISIFDNKIDYNGTHSNFFKVNYSLSNFGMIFKIPTSPRSQWKGIQFSFGYNRVQDFNNEFQINGQSRGSSMMDQYIQRVNGTHYEKLSGEELFLFNTWFLDTLPGDPNHYTSFMSGADLRQRRMTTTSGGIDEINFSVGGNYNDNIYIGASLGIPVLKYNETSSYSETDINEEADYLYSYSYNEQLSVKGTGVNLKLGIIYQPLDFMRIGVAFHTPTYYGSLKDTYTKRSATVFDDDTRYEYPDSDERYVYISRYRLNTPLRAIGSLAFIIQKRAFISVDYEFTHYGGMYMYSSDYSYTDENENIRNKYKAGHTIRVGTELSLSNSFLLRLGYNFISNPYKAETGNRADAHVASAGLGFRSQYFFFDLAYSLRLSNEKYWMYSPEFVSAADMNTQTHRIAATFGVKF